MSDNKSTLKAAKAAQDSGKAALKAAKASPKGALLSAGKIFLANPSLPGLGLPPGFLVHTNASKVARFPLPATIGSSVVLALGVFMMLRGRRVVGVVLLGLGGAGLGAAAAAPEILAAIDKARAP